MYVRAGRPAFARPCVGVHKITSLMSSSLLLQQCPACLEGLASNEDYVNATIQERVIYKKKLIAENSNINRQYLETNRKKKKTIKKKSENKNNCMHSSSGKLRKLHNR